MTEPPPAARHGYGSTEELHYKQDILFFQLRNLIHSLASALCYQNGVSHQGHMAQRPF